MRLYLILAAAAALFVTSAQAEDVRFPESGAPAFVLHTPDGWTHQPDGGGNMLLVAGNHSASFALTVGPYDGNLDDLATGAMKSAGAGVPQNMGPITISGYRGYVYDSSMTNPSGLHVNVHMVVVKTDPGHMCSITMLSIDSISGDDYAAARSVIESATIDN